MRVAIVSDIHGNRQAFEAVLDAIEASECQEMWCLGDLVGYGAEPDACVELARFRSRSSREVRRSRPDGPRT
jgi:Icc-related predicted phosphoesterase